MQKEIQTIDHIKAALFPGDPQTPVTPEQEFVFALLEAFPQARIAIRETFSALGQLPVVVTVGGQNNVLLDQLRQIHAALGELLNGNQELLEKLCALDASRTEKPHT